MLVFWVVIGECEERLQSARDQLENYVMTRLGARAFELCRSEEEDNLLLKRMKLLSFLTPEVSSFPCAIIDSYTAYALLICC